MPTMDGTELCDEAVELFKALLRVDTTNPPGNEAEAVAVLEQRFDEAGLDVWVGGADESRPNLVVRVPATVDEPDDPLLLAGHTDVVPAEPEAWRYPPFDAVEAEGCIWGRGAVDMKNMVAMSAMATIQMSQRSERCRDVIFAAVADEEAGCDHGSKWLVDNHPDKVRAGYMLGEVGGFWLHIGDQAYLPIMQAEKGTAELRLRARGQAGHGSMPTADSAVSRLANAIDVLASQRLSYRLTDTMEAFLEVVGRSQPMGTRLGLKGLGRAWSAGYVIDHLLGDPSLAQQFDALLHNTATPTVLSGGVVRNQIPGEAICEVDGRTLPGVSGEELKAEVETVLTRGGVDLVGPDSSEHGVAVELTGVQPGMETDGNGTVMSAIREVVEEAGDSITPVPYMIPGYTDARHFSRLGVECFGFSPVKFSPDFEASFGDLFHGVDERIPVEGFRWGMRRLDRVVSRIAGVE
jgi:acetylornithine deacetylase/succinyl-diaminopimelate desuccinylase-like protein